MDDIYKQIAEELHSQYRLGFSPTDHSDGHHKIVVDLPNDKKSSIQRAEATTPASRTSGSCASH